MKLERQTEVINRLGLHARASAKLVKSAGRYASSIRAGTDSETVDGKSIMGLMMLAAGKGSKLTIRTEGPIDAAKKMLVDLEDLFARRFEEV